MLEHHVITRSELKAIAGKDRKRYNALVKDPRNLIAVEKAEHDSHHNKAPRFPLSRLPDSVYEFGVEVMGAGKTYNFLRRNYGGEDPRLENLLGDD